MAEARRELLPGLHGLRAAAAMAVLLFHLHAIPQLQVPQHLPWIATHFGLGVHLFFALSAFSLAWANPQATSRPGPYLIKRFFRIAPLYWLLATLVLLVHWAGIGRAAAEFAFVFNFIPGWQEGLVPTGWTVGVEMPFYVALLLLLRIRSVGGMAVAAGLATLLSWQSRLWLHGTMPGSGYADVALASNAWVFVLALLAYRIFACTAITLPPLCLAAALGYRLVEQPGMALGRALITRLATARKVGEAPLAVR